MNRIYKDNVSDEFDDIYTIDEWKSMIANNFIWNDCGSGYWVKDNLACRDEVFSSEQLDATHVVWYSK